MQKSPNMADVKQILVVALMSLGWNDAKFESSALAELLDDVNELHKAVADAEPSDADDADKLHPALKELPKPILRAFLSGYIRVHECAERVPVPAPLPNEKFKNLLTAFKQEFESRFASKRRESGGRMLRTSVG